MLAGEPPHTGGSAQQIIMKIIAEQPQPVTELRKSVPPNVAAAVGKALEKLPADRFESAKAFAEALANPAFSLGPDAMGVGERSREGMISRRTFAMTTAGFVLIAAALATWGWTQATPTPDGLEVDILLSTTRFDGIANSSSGSIEHRAAIAPDGSAIVFTDSTADATELHIKWRGEHGSVALEGTTGGHAPIYSPEGQWIAYSTEDGRIRKMPAGGGGSTDTCETPAGPRSCPPGSTTARLCTWTARVD